MQRSFAVGLALLVLTIAAPGCGGGSDEEISIFPDVVHVTEGLAPGSVGWTLEGPGTTTPPGATVILYTPPATGGDASATLTASAQGRFARAVITVHARL